MSEGVLKSDLWDCKPAWYQLSHPSFFSILYFVCAERSIGIIHKGTNLPIFTLLCISVKTSIFKWGGSIFGQICVTSLMNVPYWVSSSNDIPPRVEIDFISLLAPIYKLTTVKSIWSFQEEKVLRKVFLFLGGHFRWERTNFLESRLLVPFLRDVVSAPSNYGQLVDNRHCNCTINPEKIAWLFTFIH